MQDKRMVLFFQPNRYSKMHNSVLKDSTFGNSIDHTFLLSETWDDFVLNLNLNPDLVGLHSDIFSNQEVSIVSLIKTIEIILKLKNKKAKIFVSISKDTDRSVAELLRKTNIAGLQLSFSDYGVEKASAFYKHLLENDSYWPEEELVTPFEELFNNCKIDELGNLTKPLYASDFGERINESMRALAVTTFLLVQTLKMGKDANNLINRFLFIQNDLANNLNNYNTRWGYQSISTLFGQIGSELVKQIKARLKKDPSAEAQSAQLISQAFSTFETTFVDQVINQHPERFTQTAPVTFTNSRDIM